MKALKGLLIYIGIVLAMILGIAILLFAGMYFFPSFRIMGVGVVHGSADSQGTIATLSDYSGYSQIELNVSSKQFNINIDVGDEEDITYGMKKEVFGIAFDITEYRLLKDISLDGSTLKISLIVTEPEGLISNNSSYLNIVVPRSANYSMLINTTAGAVGIGASGTMNNIKNLTVTTNTGKFSISGVGTEGVENSATLNLTSLNLTTGRGNFNLTGVNDLRVTNTIKLQSNNGTFTFDKVRGSFEVTGKGLKLDAKEIIADYNGFKFISENGFFNIGKIVTPVGAENTIVTENCDVKIDEISGRTGIITTYGNITIGVLNDYSTMQSEHGNVTITKAKDDINIDTEFGNITVSSYEKNGRFISKRGNIDVKSTGEYKQGVYTQIENTEGSITVDNKINRLLVTTYGSSRVEITYREIKGSLTNPLDVFQHKVSLNKYSTATIYMPTQNYNTPFKFIAKGDISGEISGLIPEYGGDKVKSSDDFQYFPSASKENEELCRQSCYFEFYGTIVFRGYLNA